MNRIAFKYMDIIEQYLKTIPVDVEKIANALGINVIKETLPEKVSGILEKNKANNTFTIRVEEREKYERQRFIIAHEIAHFMLHQHLIDDKIIDNRLLMSATVEEEAEKEASNLAGEILMPYDTLLPKMREGFAFKKLAEEFQVTEISLAQRIDMPA